MRYRVSSAYSQYQFHYAFETDQNEKSPDQKIKLGSSGAENCLFT
ncbi:MAG: hypothetical protein ACD_39C01723G0002 [uncultured bacterium]|nr:MAG: hypothetical protein ACD_39C01723G0002 [uncultured bacterium]